ncbi:MAG: Nif3-like dinuclear metal center hexameric protein [Chitinophagaceae bacterium]|nr:MAG: Nif3-like dinuclear metal center hexameric protein [Chitinophagaceae bacterium]
MKVQEVIAHLESIAAPSLQENYDNAGLVTGSGGWQCTGVMICLDSTPEVIEEAINSGINLVVAHHPIIFSGLKKLNGKNYVEKAVILAIKNDIAIYAIHTNLDNIIGGVNKQMADKLGLINRRVLLP